MRASLLLRKFIAGYKAGYKGQKIITTFVAQMDAAFVPRFCGQSGTAATVRAGLQPGQLFAASVLPRLVQHWTLTTLREELIKIGAKVVRHSKKVVFQMMEVAVPRELFWSILQAIGRLCLARHGQRMNEKHQSIRVTCRYLRLMRLLGA